MIFELRGTPLRVMGTLHLLPPGRTLPAWVRSAYDWSEAVFVEHSSADFLQKAQRTDPPLEARITPELLGCLRQAAGQAVASLSGLQRGAAVVMALGSRVAGDAGADQALHGWSQADGKPFGFLEHAGDLLEALEKIDETDWCAGIRAELDRPETPAVQLQGFYEAWRKSRLDPLEPLTHQGLFVVPAIRQALLIARNEAWAARYREPTQRCLLAVGAAHLVGDGNFLQVLARISGRGVRRIV